MRAKSILVSAMAMLVVFGLGGSTLIANVNDGLISHWRFDEGSGDVAYDSAGNNDGAIYGATWTTGLLGGALDFDGVDDYVDCGNGLALMEVSVCAWVKISDGRGQIVFSKKGKNYGGHQAYSLCTGDMYGSSGIGTVSTRIKQPGSVSFIDLATTERIDNGEWHFIAMSYDGMIAKIYIDGDLKAESPAGSAINYYSELEPAVIGATLHQGNPYWYFNGLIGDVMIFDGALSAEEILALYKEGIITVSLDIKPGSCPNPLNVKSKGVLPVAVLGSEDFDVSNIDVASIRLTGVAPIRSSYEDVATPVSGSNDCECSTEGPDGFTDLTLKFETQEIVDAIGEVNHGDELVLELTGVLSGETLIEGSDCIVIRGKHKPLNRADFNGDGIVDMADFAAFAENWLQLSIVEY